MFWYYYSQHRLLIDPSYPLLSTTAIYLTLIFFSFVREQTQRRQIRSAFGQYLSPALVEQLAQAPERLVLGGEEREMTIMFSDMRGFTSISETYRHDPQGLTGLMNRFPTPLTNAILGLDFIMVKGKTESEVIYAIAGREDTAQSARFQRLRNLTIEMLACYRSRDWEGALAAIERGRRTDEAHALELLFNLYETRIRGFQKDPPPDDWNGAFALLTK